MTRPSCKECGKPTAAVHPLLDISLCRRCQSAYPDQYGFITKTRAKGDYRMRDEDLAAMRVVERPNPHWKTGPRPMQLFLRRQVIAAAESRFGRAEPYVVALTLFPEHLLQRLLDHPEALCELGPERFQHFLADRLDRLGLEVKIVGNVFRKDGGVDIIAYPRIPTVPFLLAVQAKHHRGRTKTGVSAVRDFHGVLAGQQSSFHMGIIATNTTFTPDAVWFAEHNQRLLRLRSLPDLKRWIRNDFSNEAEWREIPRTIELAPGVRIDVLRPQSHHR